MTFKPTGAPEVDHIELRWTTGQTVINLDTLPSEPPTDVTFTAVENALQALTVPKEDDHQQQEQITEHEISGANGQSVIIPQTQTGYAEAALDRAAHIVRTAPDGSRNNALSEQAPGIYELINGGELNLATAEQALTAAALAAGLGEDEIRATLKSARDYVGKKTRTAPESGAASSAFSPAAYSLNDPETGGHPILNSRPTALG